MNRQIVSVRNTNDGAPLLVEMEDSASATMQKAILNELQKLHIHSTRLNLQSLNSFIPSVYDQIILEYTDNNLTKATFKSNNKITAVINMVYTNNELTRVFK